MNTVPFDFTKYPDNPECRVRCADGEIRIARCFKHFPASDFPEIWDDDWITNADDCNDNKNGRLCGSQTVEAWEIATSNDAAQPQAKAASEGRIE